MSSFDDWAATAADPPRCPDCGSLLRRGSVSAPNTTVYDCPMCPEVDQ